MHATRVTGPRWASPGRRAPSELAGRPLSDDRRGSTAGSLVFVALVFALTWAVFAYLDIAGYQAADEMASIDEIVDTSTTVLAAVVGGLCLLRWRLVGEPRDLALAVGFVVLGAVNVGFDELVVPHLSVGLRDDTLVAAMAPSGFLVGLAVLSLPVLPLPTRLRERLREVAVPTGVLVLVVVALSVAVVGAVSASPPTAAVLAAHRDVVVPSFGQAAAHTAVALATLLLAVRFWMVARPAGRSLFVWIAFMLCGLAQAHAALALSYPGGDLWLAEGRILWFEGMLFALLGVNRELQEHVSAQASELRRSMARARSIEVQREAERLLQREQRHDLRSALFAIRGIADLLGRDYQHLDAETIETLMQGLGTEMARLQELVSEGEREHPDDAADDGGGNDR